MKKKILPILLAVLMVFAMMPIAARTVHADSKIVVNHVEYTLNADETATVSWSTDDLPEEVVIPGTVTSDDVVYTVTGIGLNAFIFRESLKSITIPAGVTTIEEGAFYGCNSLTTVHFGGSRSQWEAITGGGKPAIELVDFGVEDPKADVSLNLSFYKKETETWIDADNDTYITSATINGTDTRSTQVPFGAAATISITPAAGYKVQGVTVNGSPRVWEVPDFRSWTDQETGIHTITFTPAEGESYAFSVSLHETVRVTYDLNGGTTGDDWLGSTRLVSKGSVETAIGYEFDKITPPNGKVLSSVEMTTGGKLYTITAADLYSTAHTYNSDVTFKCIWGSNQPDPDPQPQPGPQPQPAAQTITASNITKTYGNADFNLNAKTSGNGKLTYKSANTNVVTVDSTGKVTIKGAGTANITISAAATANYKAAAKTITITVNKAGNPLTVKANTVKIKAEKLAVKKQTIKAPKTFKITGAQGRVTYKVTKYDKKAKKKIKVSKAGKITVKKGLKKGTYKLKVNVTAAGNTNYEPLTKMITLKIKIK